MSATKDFDKLFRSFRNVKVGVVGDIMLDTYWWGHVDRISPEAPVPVVALDKKEFRIGGAGNVAWNLVSLGASAAVFSCVGADAAGEQLAALLKTNQIDTRYLLTAPKRITTNKTRIISRQQQMLRLDEEITEDLSRKDEDRLIESVAQFIRKEKPAVIILEDYNKGVLTESVIKAVVDLCKINGVITAVDPKRRSFFSFTQVDVFKPNLKEIREALHLIAEPPTLETLSRMHQQLQERLQHQVSLITLSELGLFYQQNKEAHIISSHYRNIADVSGAGDTVIAVAALVYSLTRDARLMAGMANIAGGIVCETVGTAPIDKKRFLDECKTLLR
ncbi:MAG: bifunctional heptose 7-phosphate kinase/heptose 1-phosphate adenyltransferase [Chitinophagaceae bacterium]